MKTCSECGFPVKFVRFFDWRSDGTIVGTDRVRMQSQITFLESSEMESLFDDLAGVMGIPIDHILIEAEKNVGKAFYASTPLRYLKYAPRNRYVRPAWVAKASVRVVRTDVAGLGSGIISADSYRGGTSMVIRFKNPCFIPRLVGTSLGIYESIEGIHGADYQYGLEDGDLVIWMRHPSKKKELLSETRLYLDEIKPFEGLLSYDRCPTCQTPLIASGALNFDIERGIISNKITGKREFVGNVQSVNAMLRELEVELGEEVQGIIYDLQKKIARERVKREHAARQIEFWEGCLTEFALRGLGFPVRFENRGDSVLVETRNAYNQTLYAARIATAFEVNTGLDSEIEWETREPDHGIYMIRART